MYSTESPTTFYSVVFTVSSAYYVTNLKTLLRFESCIGVYPAFFRLLKMVDVSFLIHWTVPAFI